MMFEEKPYEPTPDLAEPPAEPPKVYVCRHCLKRSDDPGELCVPMWDGAA